MNAGLKFMAASGLFGALLWNTAAANGAKPCYRAEYATVGPKLDGSITDPAWKKIAWSSGFARYGINGCPVGDTRFKALYTCEGLYFAVECFEPQMDKIHDEKQGAFWTHDVVELFLQVKPADGAEEQTHLLLSARGAKNDEFSSAIRDRTNFKTGWGGAARLAKPGWFGKDAWTAEIFVPFFLVGAIPEKDWTLPANLCRHASPRKELSSWSFQKSDFHNAAGFGVLTIAAAPQEALPSLRKNLVAPHFVSVPCRFDELRNDYDLLQSVEGKGLIGKLAKSLVESGTADEQAAALSDFNRLEQLCAELRRQRLTSANKLIFNMDK